MGDGERLRHEPTVNAWQLLRPRHNRRFTKTEYERRYNLNQLQCFEAALNQCSRSFQQARSTLDFGCGSGRLLQPLMQLVPSATFSGCDVSPMAVAQCRHRCAGSTVIQNATTPPLDFEEKAFDLIYSYSVFTHLSESNHLAWLKELTRTLMPGGVMLHTTHSCESIRRMAQFSPRQLPKYQLSDRVETFITNWRGFHYVVDDPSTSEYGLAVISKDYVLQRWPAVTGLRLLAYVEGAIEAYPEGCQDLVILAKESS